MLKAISAGLLALTLAMMSAGVIAQTATAPATQKGDSVLQHKMNDIDGKEVDLASYKGKVLLMVNVASKCGHTKQYADLQKLYDDHKDAGLVVMGFPANNFKGQEPGTEAEIKQFCSTKYGVTFPMFSKISVKGDDIHPLYKQLTAIDTQPKGKGDVSWNFEKFLIGRDGTVIARFAPGARVTDEAVSKAITEALAAK